MEEISANMEDKSVMEETAQNSRGRRVLGFTIIGKKTGSKLKRRRMSIGVRLMT